MFNVLRVIIVKPSNYMDVIFKLHRWIHACLTITILRTKLNFRLYTLYLLLSCFFIPSAIAQELRDPTLPIKIEASQTNNNSTIKAIIISPNKKIVMFDDRSLTIGDEIGGEKIIDINLNSVKLKSSSGEIIDIPIFNTIMQDEKENKS